MISPRTLTEAVLEDVAPEEAFLAESYDPNITPGNTARGPHGFGVSDAITLLLPSVYLFFQKFTEGAATELGEKDFAAILAYLKKDSQGEHAAAHNEVSGILAKSGMPAVSIPSAATSILAALQKHGGNIEPAHVA